MHPYPSRFLLLMSLFITTLSFPTPAFASPNEQISTPFTPIELVSEAEMTSWAIGGGFLYWTSLQGCKDGTSDGFLKRMPSNGGARRTLATVSTGSCNGFVGMVADNSGLYYYNANSNQIEHRSIATPDTPNIVVANQTDLRSFDGIDLVLDGQSIYWISSDRKLVRAAKNGNARDVLVDIGPEPTSLSISGTHIHWLDGSTLWQVGKTCAPGTCTPHLLAITSGDHLLYDNNYLYWVDHRYIPEGSQTPAQRILRTDLTQNPSPSFTQRNLWIDFFCVADELCQVGDFDGDGKDDIITFVRENQGHGQAGDVWVSLSNGTSFDQGRLWIQNFCLEICGVGDFNGDGSDDIFYEVLKFGGDCGGHLCSFHEAYVSLSNGSGFDPAQLWDNSFLSCRTVISTHICLTGDFDGDNRDDIVSFKTDNGLGDVSLSSGVGFSPDNSWVQGYCFGTEICKVGDFNGDGKDDIVAYVPGSTASHRIAYSDGTKFVSDGSFQVTCGDFPVADCFWGGVGDIDGDGLDDLIYTDQNQGRVYVNISRGNGFWRHRTWQSGALCYLGEVCKTGDFNGDGAQDVAAFIRGDDTTTNQGDVYVGLSNSSVEIIYTELDGKGIGALATNGIRLVWSEPKGQLRRIFIGGSAHDILTANVNIGPRVFASQRHVYFEESSNGADKIFRIPISADAVYDFSADAWEVTQGIQSLNNDVPLVANKSTYVRVYGRGLSGSGYNPIETYLSGFHADGTPLPNSPLKGNSLSGTSTVTLYSNSRYDRGTITDGWLFELPPSWTQSGNITLQATVNPRGVPLEPEHLKLNNSLSGTFAFADVAPVCLAFVPVRSHAPIPTDTHPVIGPMVDLYSRLWPISDVRWMFLNWPIEDSDLFSSDPNELDGDDDTDVLDTIAYRFYFSNFSWPECRTVGAKIFYVGLVHQQTDTGGTLGVTYMGTNVSWVKLNDTTDPSWNNAINKAWNVPIAGLTLAHELGHDENRRHIKCPQTGKNVPDDTDPNFPYDECKIDDALLDAESAHYGFNISTQLPIAPDKASDFMTYSLPQWVSDYTWKAIFERLKRMSAVSAASEQEVQQIEETQTLNTVLVESSVFVTGIISPTTRGVSLDHAWSLPTAILGPDTVNNWQTALASAYKPSSEVDHLYHLRLVGVDDVILADYQISLQDAENHYRSDVTGFQEEAETKSFIMTFAAPIEQVQRVEVLDHDDVLLSKTIGSNLPNVEIIQPRGDEELSDELLIAWSATDEDQSDQLRYIIQLSSDMGQSWLTVKS